MAIVLKIERVSEFPSPNFGRGWRETPGEGYYLGFDLTLIRPDGHLLPTSGEGKILVRLPSWGR